MIDVEMLRPTADEMLSGLSAGASLKEKVLFRANAVTKLPEIADEMLSGLTATPALRHRILVATERKQRVHKPAADATQPVRRPAIARFTPVVGMALVLTLMIGLGALHAPSGALLPSAGPLQSDFTAGRAGTDGASAGVPQYRSLFADGSTVDPPLIGVNGRYYRMLNVNVPQSLTGSQISEVTEFTDEPSLAPSVSTVSNIVAQGSPVYMVDGLSQKTACVAEVDGVLRLFQRVGYASTTLLGNELFEDSLDIQGQVAALELSGVGVINDEQTANELIYMLSEFAVYHGDSLGNTGQALTIYLANGLSLQLMVQDDILGACGAWACPEFFDAFEAEI